MRIKKIVCFICMILLTTIPQRVYAGELPQDGYLMKDEGAAIEILTSSEAERLYHELSANDGPQPYSDLGTCDICISESGGKLVVVYSTSCGGVAEKIGVRNMTLQQKKGLKWKNLVIRSDYSEDTYVYFGGFTLENPEAGARYRVKGIHYMVKDSAETTRYAETDTYVMPKK